MDSNQETKSRFKEISEKLNVTYIRENLNTILPLAGAAVGFIGLVIIYVMFFGGGSGNIEEFILDYAGVAKAERRDCAIRHFGSPDVVMQGTLLGYKDRGVVVDIGSRDFLLLIGTDLSAVTVPGTKTFTGTIVHNIRITEPFDKVVEVVKKNQQEGKISKVRVYSNSCSFVYEKNNKKFKIRIQGSNGKILFAQIILKN